MVKLTKIYTRTGDDGTTGLSNGTRTQKDSLRIRAIGAVDELNSHIGVARIHLENLRIDNMLMRIQNDLFDLGADLSTPLPAPGEDDSEYALRMVTEQTTRIERELDSLNDELAPLDSFILPGGSAPAAYLHVARACARRAERDCIAACKTDTLTPAALTYLNRLSDFLFVAARWCNAQGAMDVKWVPGANRQENSGKLP